MQPARRAFEEAASSPAWLGLEELATLQAAYPAVQSSYRYDTHSVEQRARNTVERLLRDARTEKGTFRRFLDLGAWDGMVCYELRRQGKAALGIDIRAEGLEHKAR